MLYIGIFFNFLLLLTVLHSKVIHILFFFNSQRIFFGYEYNHVPVCDSFMWAVPGTSVVFCLATVPDCSSRTALPSP